MINIYFCSLIPKNKRQPSYNIISRGEKGIRLDLNESTGRPKKVTQRVERKIMKTVYDSLQSSTRGLAIQQEKDLGLRVSHEAIRNVIEKHKYSSKTPAVCTKYRKELRFATEHVSNPPEYWNDVIFSDETKIMLCYHNGPQRVWSKPLTALENKNLIPTVKFGKLFRNGMGLYIQEGCWCNQHFV